MFTRLHAGMDTIWTQSQRGPRSPNKAHDCDKLDAELAAQGVELIAPHRAGRKLETVTQDRRPSQRYRRRWTVERSIAWIQNFHRLCIRWEKSTKLLQGLLHLACTFLLLRPVLG
jgi:transposase